MTKPKAKSPDKSLETQEAFYRSLLDHKNREIKEAHERRINDCLVMQIHALADQVHDDSVKESCAALDRGYTSEDLPASVLVLREAEIRLRSIAQSLVPSKR